MVVSSLAKDCIATSANCVEVIAAFSVMSCEPLKG